MNRDNDDKLGFYRFMPVSKKLGLEPFIIEGSIWPNKEYYDAVGKLQEYIGKKLYFFSGMGINPEHHKNLEGILRLDEKMIYNDGADILLPHTLLLSEGTTINLAKITHICTAFGIIGSKSDALRAVFEGGPIELAGNMMNPNDPYIIYRNEENIQAGLQKFKEMMIASQTNLEEEGPE